MATSATGRRSQAAAPLSFILTLGPAKDTLNDPDVELLTMGWLPLNSIPSLFNFCRALSNARLLHQHVKVRYAKDTTTPILRVSHVECQLQHANQHVLLMLLCKVSDLTSFDVDVQHLNKHALGSIPAPHMTVLRVRGELQSVFHLLAALETRALSELNVHFRRKTINVARMHPLAPHAYAALRAVRLEEGPTECRSDASLALTSLLRPLFDLALEDVELILRPSRLAVRNTDLVAVARAWPSARRLVFGCARFDALERPTLNAMYMVSQCCPCLEELALPALDLDLGHIEGGVATCVQPKEGTGPGARGHPLRVFRVASKDASAEISDAQAERVAEYVDGLFPNIDIKRSWVHDGSVEAIVSDWYLVWVNITVTKALRTIAASEA